MSYVDKHPDPGEMPEKPTEPADAKPGEPGYVEYMKKVNAFNKWLLAKRRYVVAKALDAIVAQQGGVGPVENIVYVLGVSWLEGSNSRGPDFFSAFFPGLL